MKPKTWKGKLLPVVSEQEFRQWYEKEGLTTYQIAANCGVSRRSVFRWMIKWGIDAIPRKRIYESSKNWTLTNRQKELLVGTLLGDGCLGKHGWHSRLLLGHCEQQKGLIDWMWQEFQPLAYSKPTRKVKKDDSVLWSFVTLTHPDFDFFDKLFYDQENFREDDSRIKIVRPEIEAFITPLSLAVWFMDDGVAGINSAFSTEGFTKQENERLQDILLRKFEIETFVRPYTDGRPYWRLVLQKKGTQALGKIIDDNLVPCMKYKTLCNRKKRESLP